MSMSLDESFVGTPTSDQMALGGRFSDLPNQRQCTDFT